jgi:hypothetical protein
MHSYEQPPPAASGDDQETSVKVVNITVGSTDGTVSAGRPMRVRTAKKVGGRRRDPNRPHPLQQQMVAANSTWYGAAGGEAQGSDHTHLQQRQGLHNGTRARTQPAGSPQQQGGHKKGHEAARKKHQQQKQQHKQQQEAAGDAVTQTSTPQQQQAGGKEDAQGRALLQRAASPSPAPGTAAANRSRSVVNVTVRVAGE